MARVVIEQSASSEQDIAILKTGKRTAPNIINLTNAFMVKSFSLFGTYCVLVHCGISTLREKPATNNCVPIIMDVSDR